MLRFSPLLFSLNKPFLSFRRNLFVIQEESGSVSFACRIPLNDKNCLPTNQHNSIHKMDKSALAIYFGNDEAMLQKFVALFLENAPALVNRLDEALATADWQAAELAAHTLKGQLRYFGAEAAVERLQKLEDAAVVKDPAAGKIWAAAQADLAEVYRQL